MSGAVGAKNEAQYTGFTSHIQRRTSLEMSEKAESKTQKNSRKQMH